MLRTAVAERYKDLDRVPPKAAQKNAERGLELREEQGGDKAGLTNEEAAEEGIGSGVQRAVNLKNGDALSIETIKDMYLFFSRFKSQIAKARKLKTREEQIDSNMYVSDLLWGGEAAEKWVNKLWEKIQKIDEEAKKKTAYLVAKRYFESGLKRLASANPALAYDLLERYRLASKVQPFSVLKRIEKLKREYEALWRESRVRTLRWEEQQRLEELEKEIPALEKGWAATGLDRR